MKTAANAGLCGDIVVEQNGVVIGTFTALDFHGSVTVTDEGNGVAKIDITGGGSTTDQRFIYTATGAEGDSFDVNLPAARASTNYGAVVMPGIQAGGFYTVNAPTNLYTTTHIHLNTGVPPTVGDTFVIFVEDLT